MSFPLPNCAILGCLAVFALTGCAEKTEPETVGGGVILSLLPANGVSAGGDVTAATVAAIRSRLGRIGFEQIEVLPKGNEELVLRFGVEPENSAQLLKQAFARLGNLELRQLHPDTAKLSKDLRLLSAAGADWGIVSGNDGERVVVSEAALLTNSQISKIEVKASAQDSSKFDVIAHFEGQNSRLLKGLRSALKRAPLALILDGRILQAPVPRQAMQAASITLSSGTDESTARELAFILEAPLVVPLQIRNARGM